MNTKLVVIQGDISRLKVDAIVQSSVLDECLDGREDLGQERTVERLSKAYVNSLEWAAAKKAKTVAFPNIEDEHVGFSKSNAALVALTSVRNYVREQPGHFTEVIFVCWDTENYHLYKDMLGGENRAI